MKKKELAVYRKKEIGDLQKIVNEKTLEAREMHMQIHTGQEKNTRKYKSIRHEIAQILTIIREKEIISFTSDFLLEKESQTKKKSQDNEVVGKKKGEKKS